MIGTDSVVRMAAANHRFCGRHLGQLQRFHQSVHSSDTDMDAIITLENKGNFICSGPLVVVGVNMENQRRNVWILPDTGRRFSRKMFVVSASVDIEDPAERFDAVL